LSNSITDFLKYAPPFVDTYVYIRVSTQKRRKNENS